MDAKGDIPCGRFKLDTKILLVEIDSLDKGDGCFASNKYFSVFLHKSEGQIANAISELRKKRLANWPKIWW